MPPNVRVVSLAPLKTATILWRPRTDSTVLTVVCKATYAIEPGESPLAEAQDDVNERDLHAMNNPSLGLHSASDLVPFKARADVTLVGKAYSPPGELARALVARLKVGSVDKRVSVHADRFLRKSGRIEDEKFFSKMALGYENAPGGEGTANPAGMGMDGKRDRRGRLPLPNLQHPADELDGAKTKLRPVGFGPLPATWPTRRSLVGSYDGPWLSGGFSDGELPSEWNWAFFNVAPPDQQLEEIAADQAILLEHLHPEEPKLETRLPGLVPVVYAERSGDAQRVELKGDTLWIDTNRLVATLTWRGPVKLEAPSEAVRLIVTLAKPGEELDWDAAWRLAEAKQSFDESQDDADEDDDEDNRKTIARPMRARMDSPAAGGPAGGGPSSKRPMTAPVPLVPSSDHTPGWMPNAGSSPGSGPGAERPSGPGLAGPPSGRVGAMPAVDSAPMSQGPVSQAAAGPMSQGPSSRGPVSSARSGPGSSGQPPASGLILELQLSDGETAMLKKLCKAMGYDAVDMVKHALREAYQARFGDE